MWSFILIFSVTDKRTNIKTKRKETDENVRCSRLHLKKERFQLKNQTIRD